MKNIDILDGEFQTRQPCSNSEYYNNLNEKEKNNYLALYSTYVNLLLQYLISEYELGKYDDYYKKHNDLFKKVKSENYDLYQYVCSNYFDYLYVRNNAYIERLSVEEIAFLAKCSTNPVLTAEVKAFIANTYPKVLFEYYGQANTIHAIFGPDNSNFLRPGNALILGIRYDDYAVDSDFDDAKWNEFNNKRLQMVMTLSELMQKTLSKNMNIPVYVIKYDEFSVKKKTSIESEEIKK